ncbi:hypothetical protein CTEN210_09489 [Chaetoceros tenuissimus]|uniref:Uncharacterized protein n=1 Tax=Chaetoceros tenuissimus TaxID=426638 RepID=A0AAD3H7N0_9STRA|nr:hypothetical protein CTEN210_09489 [Chaetoceros tenuissimus]
MKEINENRLEEERLCMQSRLESTLFRICGGGIHRNNKNLEENDAFTTCNCRHIKSDQAWSEQLKQLAKESVLMVQNGKRNKRKKRKLEQQQIEQDTDDIGKPHDIEIKIAPTFFHRFRHKCIKRTKKTDNGNDTMDSKSDSTTPSFPSLEITSDLGLRRAIEHPEELAKLIVQDLEDDLWQDRVQDSQQDQDNLACIQHPYEIRYDKSGIICIVSPRRNKFLRSPTINRLPCPHRTCTKWVKGDKGLWWHQIREHGKLYADATDVAKDGNKGCVEGDNGNSTALVLYNSNSGNVETASEASLPSTERREDDASDIYFKYIRKNEVEMFKKNLESLTTSKDDQREYVTSHLDRNGASALHWCSGQGCAELVSYMIKDLGVNPNQPQKGKRSFRGRTPLHWASRNGHLHIVEFLVSNGADVDATTGDGTTAFCLAAWQNNVDIMKFLYSRGAHVTKMNIFGCNAVLWSAQSATGGLETLQWLKEIGLNMSLVNSNGHALLHKSAQRGKFQVCRWIFEQNSSHDDENILMNMVEQIAPDAENCCPSDLAGMEGFEDLACWLVSQEQKIALNHYISHQDNSKKSVVDWLENGMKNAVHATNRFGLHGIYEAGIGVKKMCAFIADDLNRKSVARCKNKESK